MTCFFKTEKYFRFLFVFTAVFISFLFRSWAQNPPGKQLAEKWTEINSQPEIIQFFNKHEINNSDGIFREFNPFKPILVNTLF